MRQPSVSQASSPRAAFRRFPLPTATARTKDLGGRWELSLLLSLAIAAFAVAAYVTASPLVLWLSFGPALWLALNWPKRLVELLVITSPTFPVVRLVTDSIGAQQVSTKGLFLSVDDPILAAFAIAWLARRLQARSAGKGWYPPALLGLLLLYPLVAIANLARLESNHSLVSLLYYLKWAQYAVLLILIPQTIRGADALALARSTVRLMMLVLVASAGFAVYEVFESVRTSSYTKAAAIPRASSFFGTLDPQNYGASEDPVNFGNYAMVAGSLALAVLGSRRHRSSSLPTAGFLASLVALVLSASRAPWLAAAMAYARVHRGGTARILLAFLVLTATVTLTAVFMPGVWQASFSRFEALSNWNFATEQSAHSRLEIALNSPVFAASDQYWLIGHGHSSYRFIAEEHLSRITGGISRSLYSFLLTAWYDIGPTGLALWILFFVQLRRRFALIHQSVTAPEIQTLAWGLLGALWGLAVASMFGEVPYNWRVMGVFYVAAGVCLGADAAARQAAAAAPRYFVWRWRQ